MGAATARSGAENPLGRSSGHGPRGMVAIIDDEDFESVAKYNWHATKGWNTFYARRNSIDGEIYLHRFIMNFSPGIKVDHKDGNGLNCVRDNLRKATQSQNGSNRGKGKNNTSGYKGVTWDNLNKKWKSQISYCGKHKYIGEYDDLIVAAQAYDDMARQCFGEFAKTNFDL